MTRRLPLAIRLMNACSQRSFHKRKATTSVGRAVTIDLGEDTLNKKLDSLCSRALFLLDIAGGLVLSSKPLYTFKDSTFLNNNFLQLLLYFIILSSFPLIPTLLTEPKHLVVCIRTQRAYHRGSKEFGNPWQMSKRKDGKTA